MEITLAFKNGREFVWRSVKANELPSVFADISTLAEKDQEARKTARMFKRQVELNGAKGKMQCPKKRPSK